MVLAVDDADVFAVVPPSGLVSAWEAVVDLELRLDSGFDYAEISVFTIAKGVESGLAAFAVTIMLSVGVDIEIRQMRVVFRRPRTLITGLLLNHIAVPLLVLWLAGLFSLTTAVATGRSQRGL